MANLIFDDQDGLSRSISDAPPSHFFVKIQLFSLLTKNSIERYESGEFESGGYKWKLVLYPNGNKSKNVKEHISLYLAMVGGDSLHPGWEVHAVFRFFLLDQNNDSYLIIQDGSGKERRFHGMKVEWGLDKGIPLKDFNDASNGYLVDDTCVIGAEVFVCKERNRGKGESLTLVKDGIMYKHAWKIDNFSKLNAESYDSKPFNAGDQKWKIVLYPNGKGIGMGSHISLYLGLADATTLPPGSKIFAEFSLRIVDQLNGKFQIVGKVNHWFSASSKENGWSRFVSFGYFSASNVGLLVKDTCLVEAEVTVLGVVNPLS